MEPELKEFLEKIASSLEARMGRVEARIEARIDDVRAEIRTDMAGMESRINSRLDGVADLANSANRRDRTRELRMLALESRFAEFERRLIELEGQ